MNAPALQRGKVYCGIFAALLLAMALAYLCLHRPVFWTHLQPTLSQEDIQANVVTALEQAHFIELELSALKEKQTRKLSEQSAAPAAASGNKDPQSTPPTLDQDIKTNKKTVTDKWNKFKNTLMAMPLPYETRHLLGIASAELAVGDPAIHGTFQRLLKHLRADLESLSTAYFWTTPPWRWAEISLWATLGCLVGLLFYIAGLLKQGAFYPEEIPMFWAELLMAPIVVPVVFFLFNLSGISEFSPSQSSITTTIGVAFIFGFAIRRTIGVLDLIKKRFFPDPTP